MLSYGQSQLVTEPGRHSMKETWVLDVPRDLVFRTMNDPRLVNEWLGPRNLTTFVEEMDVHPGGRWRYVQRDKDGNEYVFHGVYHTVDFPERLVYTFEYEGAPGNVSLLSYDFVEQDGKTIVNCVSIFQTVEARDFMVAEGAEEGSRESQERLKMLLNNLRRMEGDMTR